MSGGKARMIGRVEAVTGMPEMSFLEVMVGTWVWDHFAKLDPNGRPCWKCEHPVSIVWLGWGGVSIR